MAVKKLTPLDRWTLGYVVVATLALGLSFSDDTIPHWQYLAAAHTMLVGLVLLAPYARDDGPVGRFLGDWYPMLLLAGLYGEIGVLTLDAGFQNDLAVQHLETAVFGSQVSYRWIREMPVPWLSAVLHSCYLAYYAILYAAPLGLWFSGRREAARHAILGVMITFYLCYVVFLFYPVAGPRYAFDLPHNAATAVGPARLAQWLLDRGDSWGAAFPSSHVAASVVATGFALRYWRPLGFALLIPTAGLVLAVVYGQFHYGVDALSGLLLAGVMLAVMQRGRAAEVPARAAESVVGVLDASA
jgi:PAP2 superfamily protein